MRHLLFALLLVLLLPAQAAEPTPYDRVTLSEQASAEPENDLMVAQLFAQAEGDDATVLADRVNRAVAGALAVARRTPGVKVSTLAYRTQPIYEKNRIRGWRVSQDIRLESRDSQVLGKLIGELQSSRLRVRSLGYRLSEERRREHIDQVIRTALQRFDRRARLIAKTLGKSGYRVVRISVNENGGRPVPVRMAMMEAAPMMKRVAPVAIEAGTARIDVTVSGEIELRD